MHEPTEAQRLYDAAKIILATCPDCGYERDGCVCYEYSDQWLEDMRAGWDRRLNELYADEGDASPSMPDEETT